MRSLYSKDSKGELRVWSIYTEGAEVIVKHGKFGGKIQEKRYTAESKNQGKANETTPEQQSVLEAEAKYVKQLKSGYFADKDDALAFDEWAPVKCHAYNDYKGKLVYPCNGGVKLDGMSSGSCIITCASSCARVFTCAAADMLLRTDTVRAS